MYGSCRYPIGDHPCVKGMLDSKTMVVADSHRQRKARIVRLSSLLVLVGGAACSHDWDGVVDNLPSGGAGGSSGGGESAGSGAVPVAGTAGETGGNSGSAGVGGGPTGGGGSDAGSGGILPTGGFAGLAGDSGTAGTAATAAAAGGTAGGAAAAGLSGVGAAGTAATSGTAGGAGAAGQGGAPFVDWCEGNLVQNGGFETLQGIFAAGWDEYEEVDGRRGTWRSDDAASYEGQYSLLIDTQAATLTGSEYHYSLAPDAFPTVSPGQILSLTLAAANVQLGPGGVLPRARIVYYDSVGDLAPELEGEGFELDAGAEFEELGPFEEQVPDGAGYARLVLTARNDVVVRIDRVCLTR